MCYYVFIVLIVSILLEGSKLKLWKKAVVKHLQVTQYLQNMEELKFR